MAEGLRHALNEGGKREACPGRSIRAYPWVADINLHARRIRLTIRNQIIDEFASILETPTTKLLARGSEARPPLTARAVPRMQRMIQIQQATRSSAARLKEHARHTTFN